MEGSGGLGLALPPLPPAPWGLLKRCGFDAGMLCGERTGSKGGVFVGAELETDWIGEGCLFFTFSEGDGTWPDETEGGLHFGSADVNRDE